MTPVHFVERRVARGQTRERLHSMTDPGKLLEPVLPLWWSSGHRIADEVPRGILLFLGSLNRENRLADRADSVGL